MKQGTSFRALGTTFGLFACITLAACASKPPAADISQNADPNSEISAQQQRLDEARTQNIDVLARSEFNKSVNSLDEAKSDLKKDQPRGEVINDLRFSKTYLADAYKEANGREGQASGVFEARQFALKAGARNYPSVRSDMEVLDTRVADESRRLNTVSATQLADFQSSYFNIERKAVMAAQLGKAQSQIASARKNGAQRRTPKTLKTADIAMANATNVIAANTREPDAYSAAVAGANESAQMLTDVVAAIKKNGGYISENTAINIVNKDRQIASLKSDLKDTQSDVATAEGDLATQKDALDSKNTALSTAQASVALQKAIENSRTQFSPDEAEAYQQGENLVIRLKKVNFASGRSDLPTQAMPILSKVGEVAKSLNASEIKVEGHTDSLGAAAANKKLSENRAEAVATYFKSNGFDDITVESEGLGFDKPIASNKSKAGRAQNRRVDIVITPSGSTVQ